jgi:hypothetical protein
MHFEMVVGSKGENTKLIAEQDFIFILQSMSLYTATTTGYSIRPTFLVP